MGLLRRSLGARLRTDLRCNTGASVANTDIHCRVVQVYEYEGRRNSGLLLEIVISHEDKMCSIFQMAGFFERHLRQFPGLAVRPYYLMNIPQEIIISVRGFSSLLSKISTTSQEHYYHHCTKLYRKISQVCCHGKVTSAAQVELLMGRGNK